MTLSGGGQGVHVEEGLIGGEDLDRQSAGGFEGRGPREAERIGMSNVVIQTRNLTKEYVRDEFHVVALKDVRSRSTRASSWR